MEKKDTHCRSPGRDSSEDKKATKRLHFKSMKKHQELLCPRPRTQFKAAVKWFRGSLCAHLPLDARGRSFPAPGAQGGLTGTPQVRVSLQLCSPGPPA